MQYQMDESNECELYVKERTSEEPWTCELCKISEIKIQLLGNLYHQWKQYELRCGHLVHPRCYRKWCFQQDVVGCPTCGPLPLTEENATCRHCRNWGHPSIKCPVLTMTLYHDLHRYYRELTMMLYPSQHCYYREVHIDGTEHKSPY